MTGVSTWVPFNPREYLSAEEIRALRRKSNLRAAWLLAHCWGVIFGAWAVFAIWPNPVTFLLGVLTVGGRQLGLAILSHDAAHGLLFSNLKLNDWAAEWLCGRPLFGQNIHPYRAYHLEHHKFTQQPNDPDLGLSAPFPITKSSFRRKVIRDLTGQTAFKQRRALFRAALGPADMASHDRARRFWNRLGPNLLINLGFLAGLAALGVWWVYPLLWLLPDLTWHALISRVRNIGEHAVAPDNNDRLRNTRTTYANLLERAFLAPYWVNYHLEHHLFLFVPCYRLREANRILIVKGFGPRMETKPGYRAVLAAATAKPESVPQAA